MSAYTPDAAMRARMDALDPPVTAETVRGTPENGGMLLVDALRETAYDSPRALRLIELGADMTGGPRAQAWETPLQLLVAYTDDVRVLEAFVARGADVTGWRRDNGYTLMHYARSAAMVRALLAVGCSAYAAGTDGRFPLHSVSAPGAQRALVEVGGADPWAGNNEGLPALFGGGLVTLPRTETVLALMLAHPPPDLGAADDAALVLAAAVTARWHGKRGNSLAWQAGVDPDAAALLLACGAVGMSPHDSAAGARPQDEAVLRVLLAHAAATLPGGPAPSANVLVQHARDSTAFTGRAAAWESEQRARIDKEHNDAVRRLPAALTEPQRAQRVLLREDLSARRLAALEEDLAAWAWARPIVEAAISAAAATGAPPAVLLTPTPQTPFAAWINARDRDGRTALQCALERGHIDRALLLMRYGARVYGEAALRVLVLRGPDTLRSALIEAPAAVPGFVLDRACAARAVSDAAADYARMHDWQRRACVAPDADALLAVFDECLHARVKRISAGLKDAVPLPAHSAHTAPLDIVSEYLGFSLVVGPAPTAPAPAPQ